MHYTFEGFIRASGANAFTLSPMKWVNSTNAVGLFVKAGRGGGTYAHKEEYQRGQTYTIDRLANSLKNRVGL